MNDQIRIALNHAVTRYDRQEMEKNSKNPKYYYNHYALAIYLGRVTDVMEDVKKGKSLMQALERNFSDKLLKFIIKYLETNKVL